MKRVEALPGKEEKVSGLMHVSLRPDPRLFQVPEGYRVQVRDNDAFWIKMYQNCRPWFVE